MEVFGKPLTEDRNVNAGRTAITVGALGGFDFPVRITGVIHTDFLRLLFPDGSVVGNWFIHGDANYGITEFEAFAINIPEPTSIGLLSLAVLALGRRARAC